MTGNFEAPEEIGRWRTIALGVGGLATLAILIAALIMPEMREQALRSWLLGFCLWGGIGIGSIGILLLQYLTGGAWGVVIRRICEAASRTLPVVFLLFLPILLGAGWLYGWTHPDPNDKIMQIRDAYLNHTFWGIRAVLYFLLWGVMVYLLNKWSKQVDDTADWSLLQTASRFSGPTMVFYVLLVSFAAIDWTMSLDQHWYSTIWGLLFVVNWALTSFSFVIVILAWLSQRAPMNRVVGKRHFHDLGKLVLALVMVWAYFNFSQFLIIWSGNLPEETQWYITRMSGGWGVIGVAVILLHFAFPYLVLLSRDVKRNAKYLAMLAIFILFMRLVDLFYIIAPAPMVGSHGEQMGFHISWMDFLAPVAVGGIWLWWFFGELRKRPLVPINDPFLESAIEHGKGH
jgi:hypothetical protein